MADAAPGVSHHAISPDGARAALARQEPGNPNGGIWIWEIAGGNSVPVTFGPGLAESPVWTPDGQIVFASNRDGARNLYRKPANESRQVELLLKSAADKTPTSVSRDGNLLLFTQTVQNNSDVWILSNLGGTRQARPLLEGAYNESEARFSPDAPQWVAYTSNESGRSEVYVREYPVQASGMKWPVSRAGGSNPRWRQDGKALFFAAADGNIMAVDITPGGTFQAGAPRVVVRPPSPIHPDWDVMPDAARFLVLGDVQEAAPFTVWQNWQAALQK
jgi:Tol biopolymer transport system component